MKPLILKMDAFGSYAKPTTVAFEKFRKGLFLVTGDTGAGKTTMVNLLMKFYDINYGDIKIDNTSIKDLTRENIHDLFTMVLQDTWLFSDTIKNNIKYNNKDISDEDVKKVCKIAFLFFC